MIVAIADIHEGINEFEREVSAQNYELEGAGAFQGPLRLKIFVDKLDNLFRFKISVFADVEIACDRCLEPALSRVETVIEQIYQLGQDNLQSDEVETIAANSKEFNLSQPIQEAILLNREIKNICREDCKGLCPNCGINLNQKSCDCHLDNIDPRFEKLKSLLK